MLEGLGVDLITHYLLIGRFKGASPHPDFSPAHYLQLHGRLLRGGKDPFTHFVQEGASKGLWFNNWQPGLGSQSPSLRFQILGKSLLDWDAEKRKTRKPNLVSIIVPVYNQGELTKACIESLYQHTPHELVELIIVDNGSDALTQQTLQDCQARWPSLHIVRNEENLNFSLGCNMGFKASQSEVVIFLNNDTTVTTDWLNPMVDLLGKPGVAAVQPKLLYPDGSIQCMGIEFTSEGFFGYPVKNDTSTALDGLESNKGLLAVSGACMAMRAQDFAKSMGFDPIYVNGQEDVDLCLRMNCDGRRTACCVAVDSTVIHHESRSSGRHKYVKNNRKFFAKRWSGDIKEESLSIFYSKNLRTRSKVTEIYQE
jgi:GT2 family glycosyltransferase